VGEVTTLTEKSPSEDLMEGELSEEDDDVEEELELL
jgi:hypothetical protein